MFLDGKTSIQSDFSHSGASGSAQKQVVIFTSESFVAHQHLRDILPHFAQIGVKPVIFLTASCKAPRANIESLQKYAFYEGDIVNEVIYPLIEGKKIPEKGDLCLTFNQLMQKHDCFVQKVDHHTDPAVSKVLDMPGTLGAISIYQDEIFKEEFINKVKEKGFLWNLHPAVLPQNRGLYVIFWSLLKGRSDHGYTLHEIDAGIDTGRIIRTFEGELDKNKSVVQSYFEFAKSGSKLLIDALSEQLATGKVSYNPPVRIRSDYFTFPSEEDISHAWDNNVRLWGTPEEMVKIYSDLFGDDLIMKEKILAAIAQVESGERIYPPADHVFTSRLPVNPTLGM